MTPITFVTFLISLYLIDNHYQHERAKGRYTYPTPATSRTRFPPWLHRLLFRPQPYEWVVDQNQQLEQSEKPSKVKGKKKGNGKRGNVEQEQERWYYHTKQRKLMRLEASDAFELRNTVVLGLCVMGMCALWGVWWLTVVLLGWWAY
ncbi:hypothetical protein F5Y15DRAFT_392716 [Xylariaceae sp. FL0016]|nr:hypothetical protein F5Y15DRAFT_392716 [Xylariaceae sp. FL0016]